MTARLRLVKAHVEFHFVVDDGDSLQERTAAPIIINSADWPTWAIEEYPEWLADLERQVIPPASLEAVPDPDPGADHG